MNKKKLLLFLQSVLCVALTVMLAAAAIRIYRDGLALKATDPLSWIYTREKAARAITPILPLFVLSLGLTIIGLLSGIRDYSEERPAQDIISPRAVRKRKKTHGVIQVLRITLIVLALVLIVSGVLNGSATDVFGKAIKICTECVGLG